MKLIFVIALVLFATAVNCQQTTTDSVTVQKDYLKLSKSQKTMGFVLLGIGVTCFAIAAPGDVAFETAGALVVVGGLSALGSIPLFIAAGKNKRKANAALVSFKMDKIPKLENKSFGHSYNPAISLKIGL